MLKNGGGGRSNVATSPSRAPRRRQAISESPAVARSSQSPVTTLTVATMQRSAQRTSTRDWASKPIDLQIGESQ